MDIDLVIFDLDNTIWDFETNSREALVELYAEVKKAHGIEHDFHVFHANYVQINYKYWSDYEKGLINKHHLRYGRFYDAFASVDFHNKTIAETVADKYVTVSPFKTIVFDGTYEILEYLCKKYKLAIITNGFNEVVAHKIKNCGLDRYFNHIQTSEDAGHQKPHPRIFEIVLEKFNVGAKKAVMIGDNLETDIAGGKNSGMHTILFDPKKQHDGYADLKIDHLKQLSNYI
ncbi:MAG TPA: YjjG family noncanonical pyrimidine nucleotidase [Flavobacteriales bacterium]|nr:YjjG family noncanonical pyrimidine nucleotidase [Flavobacteriales bacterium]